MYVKREQWTARVAAVCLTAILAGCGARGSEPSPGTLEAQASSSTVPTYDGPFFADIRGYVTDGVPFDFTHGLGEVKAAEAVNVAERQAKGLRESFEVGLVDVAGSLTKGEGCPNDCAEVIIIDYASAQTHSVLVDLSTSTIATDSVQDTVVAAPGEQGLRELYGVALADPNVAKAVGYAFVVQPVVSPFTKDSTSCAASDLPPHRCLYGVIYTPDSDVYVYVDLTSASLVDWDVETDEGSRVA